MARTRPGAARQVSGEESARVRARRLAGRVRRRLRRRGQRELRQAVDQLQQRAEHSDEQFDRQHHRIGAIEREVVRIGTQVAAIEARLEDVRQESQPVSADGAGDAQSLAVLDEVRREHQKVRARISAAARYEERLRQVEDRVSRLDEADLSQR